MAEHKVRNEKISYAAGLGHHFHRFYCNCINFWKEVNSVRYQFSHSKDDVEFKILSGRSLGGVEFKRECNLYAQKMYKNFCNVSQWYKLSNFWLFFLLLFLDIGWPKCSFRNNDWTVIGYRILANSILLLLPLWIRERHHWEWRGRRKFIMNVSLPSSLLHWRSNRHCQPHIVN